MVPLAAIVRRGIAAIKWFFFLIIPRSRYFKNGRINLKFQTYVFIGKQTFTIEFRSKPTHTSVKSY